MDRQALQLVQLLARGRRTFHPIAPLDLQSVQVCILLLFQVRSTLLHSEMCPELVDSGPSERDLNI